MEQSIIKQTSIFGKYMQFFSEKLPSIAVAAATLIIGVLLAKFVKKVLTKVLFKYKSSIGIISFLIHFIQAVIIILACMQALGGLGINTNSLLAIIGAAGFSIGFAFKEILSNLGSSMIILFFKPFEIGDYIKCVDVEGTVGEIQLFSTTLKTVDNKLIVVPNFQLTSNSVINYTAQNMRRIDFVFNVEYDTDIKVLYEIVNRVFDSEKRVLKTPEPLVGVDSMNNNIIKFIAKPWVKTDDYWKVYYELMERFKNEFDSNSIRFSRVNIVGSIN